MNDERYTPRDLLDWLLEGLGMARFDLDACSAKPWVPAARRLTPHVDGLHIPWPFRGEHGSAWCNPPYSRGMLTPWIERAAQQTYGRRETFLLTPADTSTRWFEQVRQHASVGLFLSKRLRFVDSDGRPLPGGAKFPNALFYIGGARTAASLRELFSQRGWVVDLRA